MMKNFDELTFKQIKELQPKLQSTKALSLFMEHGTKKPSTTTMLTTQETQMNASQTNIMNINLSIQQKNYLRFIVSELSKKIARQEENEIRLSTDWSELEENKDFYLSKTTREEQAMADLTISINLHEMHLLLHNNYDPETYKADISKLRRSFINFLSLLLKSFYQENKTDSGLNFLLNYTPSKHNKDVILVTLHPLFFAYARDTKTIMTFNSEAYSITERDSIGVSGHVVHNLYLCSLAPHYSNKGYRLKSMHNCIKTRDLLKPVQRYLTHILEDEPPYKYEWKRDANKIFNAIHQLKERCLVTKNSRFVIYRAQNDYIDFDIDIHDRGAFLESYFIFDLINATDEEYHKRVKKCITNKYPQYNAKKGNQKKQSNASHNLLEEE